MLCAMNRSDIDALHARLLELHRVLLDHTRADFEREHGKIDGAGAYLQHVIGHERFAWLRPLSKMLVDMDDPDLTPNAASARSKVEKLLSAGTPEFYSRYARVLALHPEASHAHDEAVRVLKSLPPPVA